MWRFRIIGLLAALLPGAAWAQAQVNAVGGYVSTTTCPTGVSQCFVSYNPVTSVVSTALEAVHVLKATPGALLSVYASNLTGGSNGFLVVINAAADPGNGAITPLDCAPFSGGVAQISNVNLPPSAYSTGIVAVVTSATTCFTETKGTLTAFINGKVQ